MYLKNQLDKKEINKQTSKLALLANCIYTADLTVDETWISLNLLQYRSDSILKEMKSRLEVRSHPAIFSKKDILADTHWPFKSQL